MIDKTDLFGGVKAPRQSTQFYLHDILVAQSSFFNRDVFRRYFEIK